MAIDLLKSEFNFRFMISLTTAVRIGTPEVVRKSNKFEILRHFFNSICFQITMLIDAGADINATCLMNRTPLILAIASKKYEIANILIDRGAKLNTQDSQGKVCANSKNKMLEANYQCNSIQVGHRYMWQCLFRMLI